MYHAELFKKAKQKATQKNDAKNFASKDPKKVW